MKRIFGVISYKGGVGTSTVAMGLARALNLSGHSVCLVDCKRCGDLDIMLGAENSSLFSLDDLLRGKALSQVCQNVGGLDFCAAPSEKEFHELSQVLRDNLSESECEFAVLDMPWDLGLCTDAVIVTSGSAASVRAAECLSFEAQQKGINTGIVVNRFGEFEKAVSVSDIVDITHSRLLGIVPYVPFLFEGESSFEKENALANTVRRLCGEEIPVFTGSKQKNRLKKILKKKSY